MRCKIKTFCFHPEAPASPHSFSALEVVHSLTFPVIMTTVLQFWLCLSLPCFYFWTQHESGRSWVTVFTPIYSSTSLIPLSCARWRGLQRAAAKPEKTLHARFHLRRPTLTHQLPANRPPPIPLSLSQTPHLLSSSSPSLSISHFISPSLLFLRLPRFVPSVFHSGAPLST